MQRKRFARITGQDGLADVLAGIEAAEAAGLAPIKINTVVMRGVNDDEVGDLAALTFEKPFHVRFIELMPFQHAGGGDYDQLHVPIGEIIRKRQGQSVSRQPRSGQVVRFARVQRQNRLYRSDELAFLRRLQSAAADGRR